MNDRYAGNEMLCRNSNNGRIGDVFVHTRTSVRLSEIPNTFTNTNNHLLLTQTHRVTRHNNMKSTWTQT